MVAVTVPLMTFAARCVDRALPFGRNLVVVRLLSCRAYDNKRTTTSGSREGVANRPLYPYPYPYTYPYPFCSLSRARA